MVSQSGPFEVMKKNDPFKVQGQGVQVAARKPSEERKRVVLKPRVRKDKVIKVVVQAW